MKCMIRDQTGTLTDREVQDYIQAFSQLYEEALGCDPAYAGSLGWLSVQEWAGEDVLHKVETIAQEIRSKADVFVLIGVGGSNNGARAAITALGSNGPEIIYAGNSVSPWAVQEALRRCESKSVYINCIAKNFATLEPGVAFRVFRQFLEERYGDEAAGRIVVTGTSGGLLEELAQEEGWAFLPFPDNIGGRFSVLSPVGLLPMAVAGVDIRSMVQGAEELALQFRKESPGENAAFYYAAARNLLYQKGYTMELLAGFDPRLQGFFKWWIQLFAESEGKEGMGILPLAAEYTEELHSLGQYVQEGPPVLFETFLKIESTDLDLAVKPDRLADKFDYLDGRTFGEINDIAFEATVSAHSQRLPCLVVPVVRIDAEHLGKLFYFFLFACYLSGKLLGVNPFNQPGVEEYKVRMFRALGKEL